MSITRKFLTTLFLLSGATFVNAQENKCTLKINQAPELRGFRLGMTAEQVKARFPFVRVSEHREFDFLKTANIYGENLKAMDGFKGIEGLSMTFLDDRIINLNVNYDSSIQWKSEEQFSTRVGDMLRLPNAWQGSVNTVYGRQLDCDGFQVRTRVNHINLFIPVEYQNSERRQQEQIEKKKEVGRQSFKP